MTQRPQQPLKNPGVSALLSLFWPGLGHVYNGQLAIGLPLATVVGAVGFLIYAVLHSTKVQWLGIQSLDADAKAAMAAMAIGLVLASVLSTWHAVVSAKRINRSLLAGSANGGLPSAINSAPSGDVGEETWRIVSASGDRRAIEDFIAHFPNHPRVLMAKMMLRSATEEAPRAAAVPTATAIIAPAPVPLTPSSRNRGAVIGAAVFLGAVAIGLVFGRDLLTVVSREAATRPVTTEVSTRIEPPSQVAAPPEMVFWIAAEPSETEIGGAPITVRWAATHAENCDVMGPGLRREDTTGGSTTLEPQHPGTAEFTIRCWAPGIAVTTKTTTVRVLPRPTPLTASIESTASSIAVGGEFTVTWTSTGATSCHVTGPKGFRDTRHTGNIEGGGDAPERLTFAITCSNGTDGASDTVTVDVEAVGSLSCLGASVDVKNLDTGETASLYNQRVEPFCVNGCTFEVDFGGYKRKYYNDATRSLFIVGDRVFYVDRGRQIILPPIRD